MKVEQLKQNDADDDEDSNSNASSSIDIGQPEVPTIEEVCDWIDQNFQRLLNGQTEMTNLLPMLHRALQLETTVTTFAEKEDTINLGTRLVEWINKHGKNESELKIVLQLYYQIINTLKSEETHSLHLDESVLESLIDLICSSDSISSSIQSGSQRQMLANLLGCIQLSVQKCKTSKVSIEKLWLSICQTTEHSFSTRTAQILVQLFDEFVLCIHDFHRSPQLIAIVQQLLRSVERDERKMACFLIKKVLNVIIEQSRKVSAWELDTSTTLTRNWSIYITIMENLEENQSHLILPSLDALKIIEDQPHNAAWQSWMNILYMRVLAHNNILVIRWAVEYFLATFNCGDLSTPVLLQFLQAVNNTSLYNGEGGGYFLPQSNIAKFLKIKIGTSSHFWELFADISWKSVPLHFWLQQLQQLNERVQVQYVCTKEQLLKIAARVRVLQNPVIRQKTIRLFEQIFVKSIENLKLAEYVQLIESLYNVTDFYWTINLENWHIFLMKLQQNEKRPIAEDTFSKRFYDILTNYIDFFMVNVIQARIPEMLQYLSEIPKENHGWLRFMIVFHAKETEETINFCLTNYEIDLVKLKNNKLEEITKYLEAKLVWNKFEVSFVRENATDWYFKMCFKDLFEIADTSMEDVLDTGTHRTLLKLSELLFNTNKNVTHVLDYILEGLKKISRSDIFCEQIVVNILDYCIKTLTTDETRQYAEAILNLDLENISWCISSSCFEDDLNLSKDFYIRGILLGDSKTGDARIEEFYEHDILKDNNKLLQSRFWYIKEACKSDAKSIVDDLLILNNELSRKKPRYFENSKEHRLKLRIAIAISELLHEIMPYWRDDLWNILLEQNNQLNVTYLFEIFIARCVPKVDVILAQLEKVPKYTASQQVSVICVTHAFCILNLLKGDKQWKQLDQIIDALLPLTMGANFQTRTYSQMAIYSILVNCQKHLIVIPQPSDQLKSAIKAAVGHQITDLMEDVRLKWPFLERKCLVDQIMYITDAPFDEYHKPGNFKNIAKSKEQFAKKHNSSFAKHIPQTDAINNDFGKIQRKMNPTNEVVLQNNLIIYPNEKNNEIYVVASLVDKLPNLGGIARTCEVLGINNLVLDSKSHVEKSDFKNLSMTAEKSLNIIEIKPASLSGFLIQKQAEGFKIVGAEQTANSASFVGFDFPKKCVLLLGHEKEGIPANLLGFLDYAVEIPQFGMVRSLNVHVTGALFMWKYCEQHIINT